MMTRQTTRAYADTSVFGGVFDEEFREASEAFFELVRRGRFSLLVSDIVRREIESAPAQVKDYFALLAAYMELVSFDERVLALREAYVVSGIVGRQWSDDAGHVAAATVAGADVIVSWNFRHIVHFDKIRLYNAVNGLHFYRPVEIRSPAEVIDYEDEDV